MKQIFGIFIVLIVLFIFTYILGNIWDIQIFSSNDFNNVMKTIALLIGSSLVIIILVGFFFKNQSKGYEKTEGIVGKKRENQ